MSKNFFTFIDSVIARDPSARSRLEVILLYPGVHAVWLHHPAHALWKWKFFFFARFVSQFSRFLTGIEIHPAARIGRNLFIDHGMGTVIGETAEIGDGVTLYHGVTLGSLSLEPTKRHPTVRHGAVIGAGAQLLGDIVIGKDARIGANAVVLTDIPDGAAAVGIPARVV